MKRRQAEPTAIFHERGTMESAVRALVAHGVRPQRILITQGSAGAPESGSRLIAGLAIGSAVGAVVALLGLIRLGELLALPLTLIVVRVAAGAASGAMLGALLALVSRPVQRRSRKVGQEWTANAGDFLVTVKPPSESAAKDVREFLALRGGHLLPSSA